MANYPVPDKVEVLDALPRSARALSSPWCEVPCCEVGDGVAAQRCHDETRALSIWLLVVDHILGGDQVGVALPSGWLQLRVDRDLTIAAWTEVLRRALDGPLADVPPDAEIAWGAAANGRPSIAILAAVGANGRCAVRFQRPGLSEQGAHIIAALWSVAMQAPDDMITGRIPWAKAGDVSVNRDTHWQHSGPLDIPSNFDEVVQRHPGNIAVVDGSASGPIRISTNVPAWSRRRCWPAVSGRARSLRWRCRAARWPLRLCLACCVPGRRICLSNSATRPTGCVTCSRMRPCAC